MPTRTKKPPKRLRKKAARTPKVASARTKVLQPKKQLVPVVVAATPTRLNLAIALSLVLGFNLMCAGGWYYLYQHTVLSFKTSPSVVAQAHLRAESPVAVALPATGINLPVVPAQIKEGVWETSDTTATFLSSSMRPTEGGNIVLYAHNKRHLFGSLRWATVGQVISLTTAEGKVHEYTIQEKKIVSPDQIEEVLPTDHEVLTVYTCTGWFDSQRLVLKAYPSRVTSASL